MTVTFVVTFANQNAARYYFNAGGQIGFNFSHPNTTNINALIADLCNEAGTIWVSSPVSGTVSLASINYNGVTKVGGVASVRSTVNTNYGFYAFTGTSTQIFNQLSDEGGRYIAYQGSFLRISASSNGLGELTFTCLFDEVPNGLTVSSGTVSTLTLRPPSTANLSNTWGTPSVVQSISYTGAYVPIARTVNIVTSGSGTFTVPSTVSGSLTVRLFGGGGGGVGFSTTENPAGGGGGGGSRWIGSAPAGTVISYTVGAGGAPSYLAGDALVLATPGGSTTFGTSGQSWFTTATGGGGGGVAGAGAAGAGGTGNLGSGGAGSGSAFPPSPAGNATTQGGGGGNKDPEGSPGNGAGGGGRGGGFDGAFTPAPVIPGGGDGGGVSGAVGGIIIEGTW
jgi:hypothetical protein